ncbi:unnamed protein product [Cochlearia groenlandica]
MSSYNQSQSALVSIDPDQINTQRCYSSPSPSSTYCPVAILWDIENCPVPSDVRPEDVAGNIRTAVQLHPAITGGSIVTFSAFGDFNAFPRRVREGCQRTGVKLVDVPNGRKDAADKAILVDMFLFALDHRPPSTIVLISGDVDFAPALHVLGQRGYTVIVIIPSCVYVNSALTSAGKFVWDWSSIVHGEGFVPLPKAQAHARVGGTYLMGCNSSGNNLDVMNDDEMILYRGVSRNCYNREPSSSLLVSQNEFSCREMSRSPSNLAGEAMASSYPPPGLGHDLESTMWVAPGDFNGLKGQIVKLLELSGGCMPFIRVASEYRRSFGKTLFVADYGCPKLVDLFKKMGDVIAVDGKGNDRFVYLRDSKPSVVVASPSRPVVLLRRENKDKDINGGVLSDELSDTGSVQSEMNVEEFKLELQDILVSYGCRIRMDYFDAIYKQRYKKGLDYKKMGMDKLEQVFEKVSDVVTIYEDPATGTKLISTL